MLKLRFLDTKGASAASDSDPTPGCPQEAVQIVIRPEALNAKNCPWLSCDQEVKHRKCTSGSCSGEAVLAGLFKFIGKRRYISHREGKQYVTTELNVFGSLPASCFQDFLLESYIALSTSSYLSEALLCQLPHTIPMAFQRPPARPPQSTKLNNQANVSRL